MHFNTLFNGLEIFFEHIEGAGEGFPTRFPLLQLSGNGILTLLGSNSVYLFLLGHVLQLKSLSGSKKNTITLETRK